MNTMAKLEASTTYHDEVMAKVEQLRPGAQVVTVACCEVQEVTSGGIFYTTARDAFDTRLGDSVSSHAVHRLSANAVGSLLAGGETVLLYCYSEHRPYDGQGKATTGYAWVRCCVV